MKRRAGRSFRVEADFPWILVGNTVWRIKRRPVWNTMATENAALFVAEGKVFTGQSGNRLVALDQKTGALLWETKLADRGGTPAPTMYYDGLVYMGIAGGEGGARGDGSLDRPGHVGMYGRVGVPVAAGVDCCTDFGFGVRKRVERAARR